MYFDFANEFYSVFTRYLMLLITEGIVQSCRLQTQCAYASFMSLTLNFDLHLNCKLYNGIEFGICHRDSVVFV